MAKRKIIVVGGGPAGLMAAGKAAEGGAEVLLLEKMKSPGRKLCITGKGRCNITNIADIEDFISHFGPNGNFLRQAFTRFFNTELLSFLDDLGLETVTERGGRVFPASGLAPDLLKLFVQWLQRLHVEVRQSSAVDNLIIQEKQVRGVVADGRKFSADSVILSTGGASYPATGSSGDGYRLGAAAGHTIVPIRPALVPLETDSGSHPQLAGLSLRNVRIKLLTNNRKRREAFGEMSFTDFGVTGPAILSLSGEAVDCLRQGLDLSLTIDLKPALDEKKLDGRLLRDISNHAKKQCDSLLKGLLPHQLIPACLNAISVLPTRKAGTISAAERRRLRTWLKDFRLRVVGHRPFSEAIVTAGGIDTREINPRTMESRLVRGLYFAGELLDIQADTGGYNLQGAFSTGWLAGTAAAQAEQSQPSPKPART